MDGMLNMTYSLRVGLTEGPAPASLQAMRAPGPPVVNLQRTNFMIRRELFSYADMRSCALSNCW